MRTRHCSYCGVFRSYHGFILCDHVNESKQREEPKKSMISKLIAVILGGLLLLVLVGV